MKKLIPILTLITTLLFTITAYGQSSLETLKANFTQAGFVFQTSGLTAESPNGAELSLTTQAETLTAASLTVPYPVTDTVVSFQHATYFSSLLAHTIPEWPTGPLWLAQAMTNTLSTTSTTQADKTVTLSLLTDTLNLTVDLPLPQPTATTVAIAPTVAPVVEPTAEPTAPVVTTNPSCANPAAAITSPIAGTAFTSRYVKVIGTANTPNFQLYKMEFSTNASQPAWNYLFESDKPVADDVLMELDTSTVGTGEYGLKLTVVDNTGNYPEPCIVWYNNGIAPPSGDGATGGSVAPKGDGFYLVGQDIAVGKWRSTGSGTFCSWKRMDKNQDIIDIHVGLAGGTMTIDPFDHQVQVKGCGQWEYVENENPVLQADSTATKSDGFYTVGVEISPGQWRSNGTGDSCSWKRLDGQQNIIDIHVGQSGGVVTIQPTDYEVGFNRCGEWEYLGQ